VDVDWRWNKELSFLNLEMKEERIYDLYEVENMEPRVFISPNPS